MGEGEPILYSLYIYAPNKAAPIVFAVLYGISAILHIWQCYRHKAWELIGLQPLCAVLFTLGYALREYGAYNYLYDPDESTPLIMYILSQVFIYVSPPLLELSNYHVLGRIFHYLPYFAPIPPNRVMAIFGGLMAGVETLNALGVALGSNAKSGPATEALGSHLTVAALCIQIFVIFTFVCLSGIYHARCVKAGLCVRAIKTLLITLYSSVTLILFRCIYRLVEHVGPSKIDITDLQALRALSPLYRYEVFFYIFEASLMLINSALWNIWHPGRFLPSEYNIYLAQDGTEIRGEKDTNKRPLLAKVANVLTFGLLGLLDRKKRRSSAEEELVEYQGDERDAPSQRTLA